MHSYSEFILNSEELTMLNVHTLQRNRSLIAEAFLLSSRIELIFCIMHEVKRAEIV